MSLELAKQTVESLNKVISEYESFKDEKLKLEKNKPLLKDRDKLAYSNKRIEELKLKTAELEKFISSASEKLKNLLQEELENVA
ncbi:hypothetical protein J4403_04005 [Candidatus Woesearchaeota archaeon]|nr:hypothetical protein [Candidatus Woesearchaeota archaeon]